MGFFKLFWQAVKKYLEKNFVGRLIGRNLSEKGWEFIILECLRKANRAAVVELGLRQRAKSQRLLRKVGKSKLGGKGISDLAI